MRGLRSFQTFLCFVAVLLLASPSIAQGLRYSRVTREVVEKRLARYAGSNQQREETLKQMFAEAGCDDQHLAEQAVKDSKIPNVICTLPGTTDKVIIVGAHFDRTPQGDGVVDNWSGASLLPSLYVSAKTESRKHTYVFIGFTDEEKFEIGSHFYAQHMSQQQVSNTDAMVNMDTLGLGPTMIWGSHSDRLLTGAVGYIAKRLNMPVGIVDVEQVGSTDSEQFAARKIRRITIHSLTQKTWEERILHTSRDKMSAIRLDDYYETYSLLAAYVTFLDEMALDPQEPTRP